MNWLRQKLFERQWLRHFPLKYLSERTVEERLQYLADLDEDCWRILCYREGHVYHTSHWFRRSIAYELATEWQQKYKDITIVIEYAAGGPSYDEYAFVERWLE